MKKNLRCIKFVQIYSAYFRVANNEFETNYLSKFVTFQTDFIRKSSNFGTAKELKMRLRAWQNCDDLTRRMSEVELVLGERKLEKNDATMEEEGWLVFGAYFWRGVVKRK